MNENTVDYLGVIQVQHSHELNGDFNSELGNRSCQYFDTRQAWNMGSYIQPHAMAGGGAEQLPNIDSGKSSNTIMQNFESPASAFYAAEHCMGFSEYDCQVGTKFLSIEQQELLIDGIASVRRSSSIPNKGNQDYTVACGSYNLPFAHLSFSSQHEKLSPKFSAGSVSTTFGNSASNGTVISSKTRIRWTNDLHEKFVECVNRLGGVEKATPKAILKMMDSDGLTIFHVKSHLQKYRIAKFMPDPAQVISFTSHTKPKKCPVSGKSDKRIHTEDVQPLGVKTGLQIREALQLQLDAQRRLHEQLEIQRTLQLRIEEQGRQLKKMFDQQQRTSHNLLTANDDTTISHKSVEVSISEGAGNSFFPS
ncbi:SANT/Myb domain [Sesbania bispinosa]|nr:SANT/Myb domain [Sesbania bispinosa]